MSGDTPPARRWQARWIWSATEPTTAGPSRRTIALRRTLDLTAVPNTVPTRLCADSRYALWVNGAEVARGPVRVNPRRRRFDVVDLAPYLRVGPNCLSVLACHYGRATAWWMPASTLTNEVRHGGFLFEADLGLAGLLASDGRWRALPLEGWGEGPPVGGVSGRGPELIDQRALPEGWQQHGFDDGDWPAARVMSGAGIGEGGRGEPPNYPHGPYQPRAVGYTRADAVMLRVEAGAFRSERVVAGTVVVDLEGPAGATVVVTCMEFAGGDAASMDGDPLGFTVTLDGTRRLTETFDVYGLTEVQVSAGVGVTVHGVQVNERLYPVGGDATFSCSDEQLTHIWQVGRRTVSLCSFDAYIDCPTREQRAWTGDSVVHQMVDLTTNTDWRLARWHPLLAAEPGPDGMLAMAVAGDAEASDIAVIPDWALHWVHSVANLWRYLGDEEEIRRLLPAVEGVLRWFDPFVDGDGLLNDVVGWVIIDWASVYTEGVCAALNGLWGRALLEFAAMAQWLGDEGRGEWARTVHRRQAQGFELLWDPDRRLYVDNAIGGRRGRTASQHGQAAAIVGGLAPPERWARLVEVLTDEPSLVHAAFNVPDGEATPAAAIRPGGAFLREGHPAPWWDVDRLTVRAQPFFRYVVHDAIAQAGRRDLIPSLCLDWNTALRRCDTSWTETWFGGTVSHGWSSTPTREMAVYVLGVEPAQPGFAQALVQPELGRLEWASGRVPCPGGMIDVRVDATTLQVSSPIPFLHDGQTYPAGSHALARSPV